MSRRLASHNADIRRLIEVGFAVSEDSNYLVVRDIPYLDANLELATGAFVATLVAIDEHRVQQDVRPRQPAVVKAGRLCRAARPRQAPRRPG